MNLDVTWSWGGPASPAPGSTAPARRGKSRLSVQAPATSWADGVPTERGLPGLMLPKHVRQSCSQGFALKRPKRLGGADQESSWVRAGPGPRAVRAARVGLSSVATPAVGTRRWRSMRKGPEVSTACLDGYGENPEHQT